MKNRTVNWAYAQELVAAGLALWCATLWWGEQPTVNFIRVVAIDLAALFCAVMLAAALGFLWSFYTKADTPFYRWLEERGGFSVYLNATLYVVAVSFFATFSLVLAKYVDDQIVGLLAGYLLILDVINLYTLVSNVAGIMRLNAKFNLLSHNN